MDDGNPLLTNWFGINGGYYLWPALSSLQKDIRRMNQAEAELDALALYLFNPSLAWNKILNASTEETVDPLTIVAVDTLKRQHDEMSARGGKDVGVLARFAMLAAGLVAIAPKDRIADEMLHLTDFCDLMAGKNKLDKWYRDLGIGKEVDRLLVEGVADPSLRDEYLKLLDRDFVLDHHTGVTRSKGRLKNTVKGEAFWDAEATKCEGRTEAYKRWREEVYGRIRKWALGQLAKAEEGR